MIDYETLLSRWQGAGLLDTETVERLRAFEQQEGRPAKQRWLGQMVLVLGAVLVAASVLLFVSANWNRLGPVARYALTLGMVAVFHVGGSLVRAHYRGLSTALHAVGTISTGAAIALVGQIFHLQGHWPGAILIWGLAALAGWLLLHDEAQETLTLLLLPSWIFSELIFHSEGAIGANVYAGRFLLAWGVLYLMLFLRSHSRTVQGILFAVSAVASVVGLGLVLEGWESYSNTQSFLTLEQRLWAWVGIAVLPLGFSLFRLRRTGPALLVALALTLLLPWCQRLVLVPQAWGQSTSSEPNLPAYLLVAAFAVFIGWWGVRYASRSLLNLGIVGFVIVVGWFYYSNIYDKISRSLGLMVLGILFLAGGWGLEKMRRGLIARMDRQDATIAGGPQERSGEVTR